jgi:hypothetical protein
MKIKYIGINTISEDTSIIPVDETHISIDNGIDYFDKSIVKYDSTSKVQEAFWKDSELYLTIPRNFTHDNTLWDDGQYHDAVYNSSIDISKSVAMTGKTQAEIDSETKSTQISTIKAQLVELDKPIPRIVEDIITAGVYTPIDSQKTIIAQKVALRSQLATLST